MRPYPRYLTELARKMRRHQTPAEELLWRYLRSHQLNGLKFKRQHRIGRYVVDFYCNELRLVVEVEGGVHDIPEQKEYDEYRFDEFGARGLHVLRLKNDEVLESIDEALRRIASFQRQ